MPNWHPEHAKVAAVHPDWDEVASTKEFNQWLRAAHPNLQRLAGSFRAEDAIRLLDEYKERRMGMNHDWYASALGMGQSASQDQFEREMVKLQKLAASQQNTAKAIANPASKPSEPPPPSHMNRKLLLTTRKG